MGDNKERTVGVKQSRQDLGLGWLAGSAVQPSKRREIEGVSGASIMDLQAQLFQSQDAARLGKEASYTGQRGHGGRLKSVDEKRNAGVEERDRRDQLHLKSTTTNRESECYAALERKAALYNKLARGEAGDDGESFEVDFLSKRYDQYQQQQQQQREDREIEDHCDDDTGMGDRRGGYQEHDWDIESKQQQLEEEARRHHREVILDLARDTKDGRQRALQLKALKEKQAQDKASALKEAYLKKQLSKAITKRGVGAATKEKAKSGAGVDGNKLEATLCRDFGQ